MPETWLQRLDRVSAACSPQERRDVAIDVVKESLATHIEWRDHLLAFPDAEDTAVGGLVHHEQCIAQYEWLLAFLGKDD